MIEEPWFTRMNQEIGKPNADEANKLLYNNEIKPNMRMSCCVPIEAWMNEMNLQVVEQLEFDQN